MWPKSPKNAVRIHHEPTSPVSALTARFDPTWTVVIDARVAACVLRIGGINMASTSASIILFQRDFSTQITQGCTFSGPDRSRNKFSRSEQSRCNIDGGPFTISHRLYYVGLMFSFVNKVGSVGNLDQLHVTLVLLLFAL